ncbi:unnamed protein product, partial [Chrysoparadoxa australica]
AVTTLANAVERELKLSGLSIAGSATDGSLFQSLQGMWLTQMGENQKEKEVIESEVEATEPQAQRRGHGFSYWYQLGFDYWEDEDNCKCNVDGVLGGFGHISPSDIEGSKSFLSELRSIRPSMGDERAADGGAGIGRVSKDLLLPQYDEVDLIEQSPRLLAAAPRFIGKHAARANCMCMGLQDFHPEPEAYDLIWIQWVVGHLADVDFVKLLKRCRAGLNRDGVLVIKDNTCDEAGKAFVLDSEDSSLTRSVPYYRSLFRQAGMQVVLQKDASLQEEIFPVYFFALE